MIQRLIAMAISTGSVTSFFALLIMAVFIQNPQGSGAYPV
jgi:hypothetical protein